MPVDEFRDEVIDRLARIEEKLNSFGKLEDRISVLEASHYKVIGWCGALSLGADILIPLLFPQFHFHIG